MFNKQKHYDNAIQKVTIQLGRALNLPEGEDCYVTLREPSEMEVTKLRSVKSGDAESLEIFKEMLIAGLVDHDFYDGDKKMSNEEVISLLYEKVSAANTLITEYTQAVFHSPVKQDAGK